MTETFRDWISVPEAARLKRVAESAVRLAINAGQLTGGKIGRNYVVRRRDVEAWQPAPQASRRGRRAATRTPAGPITATPATEDNPSVVNEADTNLQTALLDFLNGGGTDRALRERILELTGGAEALKRLARIQEGQRQFAGRGLPTEEYFRHKLEEVEIERQREDSRSAESP